MKPILILPILAVFMLPGCNRSTDGNGTGHPAAGVPANYGVQTGGTPVATALTYVGKNSCNDCHPKETELYKGSHHDLAMQEANSDTVLGNFNNVTFSYNNITSRFFQRDGRYFVHTDGSNGELADFEIKYTFGITPLQQYLIEFPGGRLQALSITWDSRSRAAGGQRWFHLYPDEKIDFTDELHWTGNNQNWNYMCAECHSTGLEKNYDLDSISYHTEWIEIDVTCEACHGPGSRHVELAREQPPADLAAVAGAGLPVVFNPTRQDQWIFKDNSAIANLDTVRTTDLQLDTCARCHSRRTTIDSKAVYGKPLHDTHSVSLLEPGLYHPDGQVDDEVYIYGSFVQSKMYAAGVNCSDCHDPHSARLRIDGNGLCGQCHRAELFDSVQHHFHKAGTDSAQCINCHMPAKNFMVIDNRHDHSFRIPRPDLSIKTGSPNPCNQCHQDESPQWAVAAIKQWYGKVIYDFHFAEALAAARANEPDAAVKLLRVVDDTGLPAIVRATAMTHLGAYLGPDNIQSALTGLNSTDALLRSASLSALAGLSYADRLPVMEELLADPVKSVRLNAARLLAPFYKNNLPQEQKLLLDAVLEEYIDAQLENSDRAYANVNLGNLYIDLQRYAMAESAFKRAVREESNFLPAYLNLAELHRLQGQEAQAESALRQGIDQNPRAALLYHALGLALVRQNKHAEALTHLKKATNLAPEDARFGLVYGIALNSLGNATEALSILTAVYQKHPSNRDLVLTLATIHRDIGNFEAANDYAWQLVQLSPANDPQAAELLKAIQNRLDME